MANIDKVSVKNTVYNIVSPAVVSDYIEVIGGACTKPDGYEEDEVILAKQNDVQLLFKATQDIAFGANIVENTNCVRTTLEEVLKNAGGGGGASSADQVSYDNSDSGLEAENVQEAVDELATNAGTASSQIQTLTNQANSMVNVLGAKNLLETELEGTTFDKVNVTRNSNGTISVSTNGEVESTQQIIHINSGFTPPVTGQYKLTGAYDENVFLIGFNVTDSIWMDSDIGNGVVLSLDQNKLYDFVIVVRANTTLSTPVIVSPMLRPNRIVDDTYVPYAMTNQELTSKLQAKKYTHLAEVFTLGYVTAVSGDTRSSMLDKLYADAASRLAAVSNDSFFVETIRLVISDGTRANAPMGLLNKTSTFPELNFIDSSIDASTGSVIHEVWNMKSSGSKQSSAVIRSDGTTLYPNDSAPVNVGVTYSLYAQRYIANDAVLS